MINKGVDCHNCGKADCVSCGEPEYCDNPSCLVQGCDGSCDEA